MKKKYLVTIFLLMTVSNIFSQQSLSFEDAVRITLQNNFRISIARVQKEIEENNFTPGNAGMLPVISADASFTNNLSNTKQNYSDGRSVDQNGAKSSNFSTGIALNWTVFDGFRMFAEYSRLKELNKNGELLLKADIENNIFDIINTYYGIVKEEQTIKVIKNTIQLSQERVRITQDKKNVGSSSKFELLQAQSDLNQDSSTLLNEELKLYQLRNTLNRILGVDINTVYKVDESILVNIALNYDELFEKLKVNNVDLLLAKQNINLSKLNTSILQADYYPEITLFTGYSFSHSKNDVGLVRTNNNSGLNYGIRASINLFDGLNTARNIENAYLNEKITALEYDEINSQVIADYENAYKKYRNNLSLVELERHNLQISAENVDIALERLKLGSLTPFEFRQVQITQLNAETRLLNAIYENKLAESELLRITGSLPLQ